jgi:hypothetical protein
VQFLPERLPFATGLRRTRFQIELLQSLVKLANRLLFVDAHVALQSLNMRIGRLGHRIREFRLATAGRSLNENRTPHLCREIHDPKDRFISEVFRATQLVSESIGRRKHGYHPVTA